MALGFRHWTDERRGELHCLGCAEQYGRDVIVGSDAEGEHVPACHV